MRAYPAAAMAFGLLFLVGCAGPDWSERPAPRTSMARVLLVRHGESAGNLPHDASASGRRLDELTPRGWDQAAAVANLLRDEPTPVVICSPARRARQTAGEIAAKWNGAVTLQSDDAFGPLGNMMGADTANAGSADRAAGEIDALARQHPGRTVVVVTHGDVISALMARAGAKPAPIPAASIQEIRVNGNQWTSLR